VNFCWVCTPGGNTVPWPTRYQNSAWARQPASPAIFGCLITKTFVPFTKKTRQSTPSECNQSAATHRRVVNFHNVPNWRGLLWGGPGCCVALLGFRFEGYPWPKFSQSQISSDQIIHLRLSLLFSIKSTPPFVILT